MDYDVLCIGGATIDAFLTLGEDNSKIHLDEEHRELRVKFGEKIDVASTEYHMGGNAANACVGLSRLGLKAILAAEIGDDEFSLLILNLLAKEHIDRGLIKQMRNTRSGMAFVINYKNDRTLFVEHIKRENKLHYRSVKPKWMYLTSLGDDWREAYKEALSFVHEEKIKLAFNPGTIQLHDQGEILKKAIKQSDVLVVNKQEAEELLYGKEAKKDDNTHDYVKKMLTGLQLMGADVVVITNGNHGSFCQDTKGKAYYQPCIQAHAIEKTGAGDGYTAGFLAAYVHGKSIEEAMLWGANNAAGVVSKIGAQPGLLKREEMEKKVSM